MLFIGLLNLPGLDPKVIVWVNFIIFLYFLDLLFLSHILF